MTARPYLKPGPKPLPLPTLMEVVSRAVLVGDCLIWQGVKQKGYGVFYRQVDGKRTRFFAHNYVLTLGLGRPLRPNHGALHDCDTPACVTPWHLHEGTQADNMRECAERGRTRNNPVKGAAHWKAKLTAADVRDIRASSDNQPATARRYGISQAQVSKIRLGQSWKAVV